MAGSGLHDGDGAGLRVFGGGIIYQLLADAEAIRMKIRAVTDRVDQTGPDTWQAVPVIMDLDDVTTVGEMVNQMKARTLRNHDPEEFVFTVVISAQ